MGFLSGAQCARRVPGSPSAVSTDLVLTFPTRTYLVGLQSRGTASKPPFSAVFRDLTTDTGVAISEGNSPGACELFHESRYARDGQPNILSDIFMLQVPYSVVAVCWSTTVNAIGDVFASKNTLLEPDNQGPIDYNRVTRNGQIEYNFAAYGTYGLVSKEGTIYTGLPVIGFSARKYVNGNIGGFVANYGKTSSHKYAVGNP